MGKNNCRKKNAKPSKKPADNRNQARRKCRNGRPLQTLLRQITITRPEPARDGMEDTDMDVLKITAPKELTEEEHARNLHQNGGSMSETFVCLADKKDK
ncbi:hypothetical protein QR680_003123 [Steinernema hermaphroditum]|uniref:Uncharacterized protein n=1 Tax=Steinernema hermaphroditum TaxID=289476 RepID=A0AA39LJK1_9BILA|nr:hypothetical protein QR680_003123 [Steinernema hermaphroditum]